MVLRLRFYWKLSENYMFFVFFIEKKLFDWCNCLLFMILFCNIGNMIVIFLVSMYNNM